LASKGGIVGVTPVRPARHRRAGDCANSEWVVHQRCRAKRAGAQLQDRLGFELPLDDLRYWLLGVPAPNEAFDLTRNEQDRAQHLVQDGWSIDYDRYMAASGDVLPAHIVLSRGDVRVRVVVDHWDISP
jgi:outer membrane lipoprotein LolB